MSSTATLASPNIAVATTRILIIDDEPEMRRTFNCGLGLLLIVPPRNGEAVLAALLNAGETAFVCGELAPA